MVITNSTIENLLNETLPSYQAVSQSDQNLGFGYIYYALTRTIRPHNICVIGSKAGFSVICFALGLKDNAGCQITKVECWDTLLANSSKGHLHFIDPSYSSKRNDPGHWCGIGFWDSKENTEKHWEKFGVKNLITHHKMTSAEYLHRKECYNVDLLYIDGDHSYEGITHDFMNYYGRLSKDGIILAHDVDPKLHDMDKNTGGYRAISNLDPQLFEILRLPIFPGLAIARKK